MYDVFPYYFAKVSMDTPLVATVSLIYTLIVYFFMNLGNSWEQLLKFYSAIFLLSYCSMAVGQFLSSLFSNPETAMAMAPVCIMPMILFGGLFANNVAMPSWLVWV